MSPPRRPRFQDDDDGDNPENPRSYRARPPPTPQLPDDDRDARAAPSSRNKSILVDPNEDPKDRQQRRRDRSSSGVRVKPPPTEYHSSDDEGTIKGNYVRHRNGQVEFVPDEPRSKRRPHDLEKKNGERNRRFRERRDGYESDEGEQLRSSRKMPPREKDNIGDVDDVDRSGGRPRRGTGRDSGYALPDRTRGGGLDDREDKRASGRRPPPRGRYDSDGDDDDDPRSRRRPPPRRGPDARHERGYDSEGPARRQRDWDDDDRYGDKRKPSRYDDDYAPRRSDYKQDRRRSQPRGSKYDDDYYDRRGPSRRDDAPIRRARSDARRGDPRGAGGNKNVWMDQAGTLFMTHAMPVIKREGGRWARRQLEGYIGQQGRR